MEELLLWYMYITCLATSVKRKRKPRSKWSRHWLLKKRLSHMELLKELSNEPADYRNYLRMTEDTYQELLCLVSPLIERQSTVMRNPISPHERLSATLRFLATGRTYKDLEFTTLISKPSLCKIIPETCKAIYMVLKKFIKFPSTTSEWEDIATDFEDKWNFPHCLGSIDGKHIRIVPPADSGSYYYNYKKTHSIVLMAIANANYEFIYCDVGTNGRISDGGVINNTVFYKRLVEKKLNIPERQPVTNSTRELNYVFVGDEAFAMRPDLLKPFSRATLTNNRRIYNYRLSRARRVIENTFGILASRFRVLYTAINMDVDNIEWVVLACCALHNFLRKQSATYAPPDVFDRENTSEGVTVKGLRCDAEKMHHLQRRSGGKTLEEAKKVQNEFCTYFNGEGSVPWQDKFALDV